MTCNNDSAYWCLSNNDCDFWFGNDLLVCDDGCCVEKVETSIPTEVPTVSPIEVEDPSYSPTETPTITPSQIVDPGPPTDDNIGSKSTKVSKSAKSKGPTSKSTKFAKKV